MYQFQSPEYFYLLLLIPAVLILFGLYLRWRKKTQRLFTSQKLLQKLVPERSFNKPALKLVFAVLIISLLSLALVNPQVGTSLETVKRKGVDIVFAIDVSKSMLAEDIQPNRLERAKLTVSRTLDELVGDRVGIITYAGRAYPQLPITTDYGAARLFLSNISTDLIPSQGTAIGEAIELAADYFDDEDQKNRLLIILSDGEDHEEGIDAAIEKAKENNITIYGVGLGTARGGPIPVMRRGRRVGYKKNNAGEVVITQLNEDLMAEIATASGGAYLSGKSTRSVVETLMEEIMKMEKKEFETSLFSDYEDQFQWLLGPAILLLIIDALTLQRKTQWFKKLNLFARHEEDA
jgi:Ca-activated chloride channel family protein